MNCGGSELSEFIDLGDQPNGNDFLFPNEKGNEYSFPLKMLVCKNCWQVQIDEFPDPEFMFSNHPYITGVNVPVVNHFNQLAKHIVEKCGFQKNDLVIDVGCNDGTLLRAFEDCGLRTLGVDPGKRTGELAKNQGKIVFETFFSEKSGSALSELGIRPDIVTATAVFYHVPDLHDFVRGLSHLLSDDSVFVVQCVSIRALLEHNEFDHFYHEHSCIHGVMPLDSLFHEHDMKIIDVEQSEIHGGSFILYVAKNASKRPVSDNVAKTIDEEVSAGINDMRSYTEFEQRVRENAIEVKAFLEKVVAEGKTIYALGAPVKGSTFLNYAGIGADLVSCAVEVNEFKIGRLVPGTNIPVVDESTLDEQPDYYLVLAWNFIDFLKEKYSDYLGNGGQFVAAVPKLTIIPGDR